MLRELVCPISTERTDARIVRLVAGQVALLGVIFLVTRSPAVPLVLAADFVARGFGSGRWSPLRALAAAIVGGRGTPRLIDRAPKTFAARVGLLFSLAILVASVVSAPVAITLAAILVTFALLESLLDICVGCLVYTYVVLPYYGVKERLR